MDWKKRFEPRILERGRSYWESGYVSSLSNDGNSVTATVSGTEDYEVAIEKRDGNITYMSCTCPYADAGNNCKHMAAVLFAMDEDLTGQFSMRRDNEGNQRLPWEEALVQLSSDELRQFLFELAQTDRSIQERITMLHSQIPPEVLEEIWGTQLAEISCKYTDRHGFIDYQNAYDFFCELDDFLNERFPRLLQTGQVLEGFRLTCMVFETAMEQDADDSDGGGGLIISSCAQMWKEILDLANSEQELEMYNWFSSHTSMPKWNFGTETVEQILYVWKWSKPLLEQNLKLLDVQLGSDDVSDYRMKELLNWRAGIMEELGASQKELAAFWKRYYYLPYVRKRELDFLMQTENYGEAIKLLAKSKEMDKSSDFLVRDYSQKLISIYQKTGKAEEFKEELRFQILSCYQRDLTYIKLYRDAVPKEEWPAFFEQLLIHPTTKGMKFELLALEEQYQRLYDFIIQEGEFHRLNRYADLLCQWSPMRVRDSYVRMLDGVMARSSDRNMYRDTIGYLQRVRNFPNGIFAAKQLADSWRNQYGRRKAMLDELRKAGY